MPVIKIVGQDHLSTRLCQGQDFPILCPGEPQVTDVMPAVPLAFQTPAELPGEVSC